jgi:hypothetical protein
MLQPALPTVGMEPLHETSHHGMPHAYSGDTQQLQRTPRAERGAYISHYKCLYTYCDLVYNVNRMHSNLKSPCEARRHRLRGRPNS